jgi:hypothetical protein
MENISSSLLALERDDQLALRTHMENIANNGQESSYSRFVKALPDMIGLASKDCIE